MFPAAYVKQCHYYNIIISFTGTLRKISFNCASSFPRLDRSEGIINTILQIWIFLLFCHIFCNRSDLWDFIFVPHWLSPLLYNTQTQTLQYTNTNNRMNIVKSVYLIKLFRAKFTFTFLRFNAGCLDKDLQTISGNEVIIQSWHSFELAISCNQSKRTQWPCREAVLTVLHNFLIRWNNTFPSYFKPLYAIGEATQVSHISLSHILGTLHNFEGECWAASRLSWEHVKVTGKLNSSLSPTWK